MTSIENEIGSSSISSTQDSPVYTQQQPLVHHHMRYQSNGYTSNGCLSHQTNQFYNSSMAPLMTTINGGANGSATACTTPTTTTTASSASTIGCPQPTTRILRPHSTPATLIWLEDNYELAEGVCIPRSVLYMHYVDFCGNNNVQPVNAASFGKIIRQQFPQLTTRRLGTRGQSRYHYYGIAIRETSVYYQSSYSKKSGQNNVDPLKREARENINKQSIPTTISSRSRTATMLPQFPNLKDVILHSSLDKDKISTFLMMYRTHCQRILDTVIRANFDEVQTFLLHFWQGVPPHLSPILECNSVINLIGVCDSILYKTIANVLLPSVLQTLPESLTKMMKQFASELDSWLRMSLYNLPETLRSVKLELARRFGQVLRRQTSLNHLSQALRMVVNNTDITLQMLRDWRTIDVQNICANIFADYFNIENNTTVDNGDNNDVMDDNDTNCNDDDTCASGVGADDNNSNTRINTNNSNRSCNSKIKLISKFCEQFEHLLEEEAQIENYLEWLESIVHKCVLYPSLKCTNTSTLRRYSRHFLLLWSAFGSRVIQDMTLQSAQSFGSFHLLRLMFDDYVLYLVEYVQLDEQMKQFLRLIPNNEPPVFTVFYYNDCEMSNTSHPVPNPTVPIEYESTVSSSTGDFGANDTPNGNITVDVSHDTMTGTTAQQSYAYTSYPLTQGSYTTYQNPSAIYDTQVDQQQQQQQQQHHHHQQQHSQRHTTNSSNYSWYTPNSGHGMYEFGGDNQQPIDGHHHSQHQHHHQQQQHNGDQVISAQTIDGMNQVNGNEFYDCIQ